MEAVYGFACSDEPFPEWPIGCLTADSGWRDWDELTAESGAMLMEGLAAMGTRGKHVKVLQHLMGFLKNHLASEDKACRRQVHLR